MNKKGFTLIELLAVIVILAIIALIATPIILNIIKESRESAGLRSAEMYLKGVETSVATVTINNKKLADGTYPITKDGDICLVELKNDNTCSEDDTLKVEMNGDKPESGSVTIANGKIADLAFIYKNGKTIVKNNEGKLAYGEKETPVVAKTIDDICTYVSGPAKTSGAKYLCEVKPGTSYNFYVLTTPAEGDTTINLIMDRNIYYDESTGTSGEMTSTNSGCVAWISELNYGCGNDEDWDFCATNEKGPITAMTYLHNATKDWTNIEPINYTYMDKETQETINTNTSYISFISTNGVAKIKSLTGDEVTIGSEQVPLRARMPIYASDAGITEVANSNGINNYLYDNLDLVEWYGTGAPPTNSLPVAGYWTLSSNANISVYAWKVYRTGVITGGIDSTTDHVSMLNYGVRPVITIKL